MVMTVTSCQGYRVFAVAALSSKTLTLLFSFGASEMRNEILMAESALSVQKSRSGRLGTLRCIFNEERQTFIPQTTQICSPTLPDLNHLAHNNISLFIVRSDISFV
jgi:hypothetical protein